MPKTNKTDDDSLQTKQENEVLQSRQVVHQKSTLSVFALAGLLLGSFLFAFFKKVHVYDSFTQGVKGAIPLIVSIFPYVATVTMLCKL